MNATTPSGAPDLVPARMVADFAYCPRLAYMEWAQGEFAHNEYTLDGKLAHRRVETPSGDVRANGGAGATENGEVKIARSITLSDAALGAIARIDLVESDGSKATPVEYKRGSPPPFAPGEVWESQRVQLCLQGLLLRRNGFDSDEGFVYYAETKQRVKTRFDDALINRTLDFLNKTREVASSAEIPAPLDDSPKCPKCSLVGICLPDETTLLAEPSPERSAEDVRRMYPARDDALPMYVQTQGAVVGKSGDNLRVSVRKETIAKAKLLDVSNLSIFGNAQVTAQATRELLERGIPIFHFTYGGWLKGVTTGMGHKNVEIRALQFQAAASPERSLAVARRIVAAKIRNGRTILKRNHPRAPSPLAALDEMKRLRQRAAKAGSAQTLLGIEGAAASAYFARFGSLISPSVAFDFRTRNRRPPKDRVNAALSFLYSMLTKQAFASVLAVGFDPYMGFYHRPRYGRPSLALDMAEEFRPIIADSTALRLLNNRQLNPETDFIERAGSVALSQNGRKKTIKAFESKMDSLVIHPAFGYSISYRRIMEVQARLLSRHLLGELGKYPAFATR